MAERGVKIESVQSFRVIRGFRGLVFSAGEKAIHESHELHELHEKVSASPAIQYLAQ